MNRATAVVGIALAAVALGLIVLRGLPAAEHEPRQEQPGAEKAGQEKRTLTAEGVARLRFLPDRARVFVTVETTAATVREARSGNAAQVKKVLTAILALKIPDLKTTTTDVRMSVVQETKKDELPRTLGYSVTHSLTALVQQNDADKLAGLAAQVLDAALENGATSVQQIEFSKGDVADIQRRALTKATEDAVANARALAAGAGRTLADVVTIRETGDLLHVPARNWTYNWTPSSREIAADATPLAAGELEVSCRVSVTCTYGPEKK